MVWARDLLYSIVFKLNCFKLHWPIEKCSQLLIQWNHFESSRWSYAMETYREMLHRISTFDVVIKHRDRIGSQAWLWFFVAIDSMRWISSDNYWKIDREGIFFFLLFLFFLFFFVVFFFFFCAACEGEPSVESVRIDFCFFFPTWSLLWCRFERLGCLSGADLNCGRIVDV